MAITRPTEGIKAGPAGYQYISSVWDSRLDTGYIGDIKRYGVADQFLTFLRMPDREFTLTTRKPKFFEQLPLQADVKLNAAIAVSSAGDPLSLVVHTDDRDNGRVPIKVADSIIIPGAYTTSGDDEQYTITAYNSSTYTATLTPHVATNQVATEIPASTVLKIHGSYHGHQTDQPEGMFTKRVERSYTVGYCKTTAKLGGGVQSLKWLEVEMNDGSNGFVEENQYLAEFQHDKKLDDMIFYSQAITNASLTETDALEGGSVIRQASKGIWNYGLDDGQTLSYSGVWDVGNYYDYKDLALSQLLATREIQHLYGYDLSRQIEQSGLDFIQTYSGGTDLFMNGGLGIDVKYFQLDGFTFQLKEIESFRNAIGFGNREYSFSKSGIMLPVDVAEAEYSGSMEQHPTIMMGYMKDRKRVIGIINGMTGLPFQVNQTADYASWNFNTEYSLIVLRPNQIVLTRPE
jgi:hypothetical protein